MFAGEKFKELHNAIYQPHRSIASSASQAEGREFESRFPLRAGENNSGFFMLIISHIRA